MCGHYSSKPSHLEPEVTSHVNKPNLALSSLLAPRLSRDVKNGTDSMAPG